MAINKEISTLKLVIDLIKVDNKLHKEEISWIEILCQRYHFWEQDLLQAHHITLDEAIHSLQKLSIDERKEIISLIEELVSADDNININEQILLAAIRLALQDKTCPTTQILSVASDNFNNYDHQLIYLEKSDNRHLTHIIKKQNNNLTTLLKSYKIDFFFLPTIISRLIQSHKIITPTLNLLFPCFSQIGDSDKLHLLQHTSTDDFTRHIVKMMGKETDAFRFDNFFLMKIQSNYTANGHVTDFLCLACSNNPIDDINTLINGMTLDDRNIEIPYIGCYRSLFEMLSEKSKHNDHLLLIGDTFYLSDSKKTQLDIRGSERKTLFTLFLLYGKKGISNHDFASISHDSPMGKLAIAIYRYFANEKSYRPVNEAIQAGDEPNIILNLRDIAKRNSHIGFIKRAFTSITTIKNPEWYYPQNVKGELSYRISLPNTYVWAKHHYDDQPTSLTDNFFI